MPTKNRVKKRNDVFPMGCRFKGTAKINNSNYFSKKILNDSFYHLQPMRMLVPFLVENAGLVEVVDADLARGVKDALVVEHHAHMDDLAILVAEESQVARLDLGQEIYQLANFDLIGGIAWKELACRTSAKLHEAAAVDAKDAASTP